MNLIIQPENKCNKRNAFKELFAVTEDEPKKDLNIFPILFIWEIKANWSFLMEIMKKKFSAKSIAEIYKTCFCVK